MKVPPFWAVRRRMVPRWRSHARTASTRELAMPPSGLKARPFVDASPLLRGLQRQLKRHASVVSAAEIVEAAVAEGKDGEGADAARRLLMRGADCTPMVRRQAELLLERCGLAAQTPNEGSQRSGHFWKRRTRLYPRDPIAWVELSLAQTVSGAPEGAERSMHVALALAPDNRFVLRAASRLYLHTEQQSRAHRLIADAAVTKTDPWLIAAELALADVAKRAPRFAKQGRGILEQHALPPRHLAELAGSLGTLELGAGNLKRAMRLFKVSVQDPSGNALAQAQWAAPDIGVELATVMQLQNGSEHAEAIAFHLLLHDRFEEVAGVCETWAEQDTFSVRPYETGAGAASLVGEFKQGLELAERGLRLRPSAPNLLNSRAFCLANLGDLEGAAQTLQRIPKGVDGQNDCVRYANWALISYRAGDIDAGRTLYENAGEGFRRLGYTWLRALASAYAAREAALAGDENAEEALKAATTLGKEFPASRLQGFHAEAEREIAKTKQFPDERAIKGSRVQWSLHPTARPPAAISIGSRFISGKMT